MSQLPKNVLRLEDGIEEMISDLKGASRTILIDEKTVGAEDITFGHSRFEPHTSIHKAHQRDYKTSVPLPWVPKRYLLLLFQFHFH